MLDGYMPGGLLNLVGFESTSESVARYARTAAFTTLMIYQMFNVFNSRSRRRSVFTQDLFRNRWLWIAVAGSILLHLPVLYWAPLQAAFQTVPLNVFDWVVATVVGSSVLWVMEPVKLLER